MSRFWKTDAQGRTEPLIPDWIYHVEVCGFTFRFRSLAEIEEYLDYYRQKIHPSSADGADRPGRLYERDSNGNRVWSFHPGDHWERQSHFDELPLYLREEPKRRKVVKALERALEMWSGEK